MSSDSLPEVYNSLPLEKYGDKIRILELDRATSAEIEISGSLTLSSLQHTQKPFEALSYTWGPSTTGERIRLAPGCYLGITDNLAAALRLLRTQGYQHRIWVDALCINQSDIQEKNHQVRMMRRIYRTASEVITWINFSIDLNNPALQLLNSMTESSTQEALADNNGWESLLPLLLDPFWKRV
jgi:hypothetical protein